MKISKKFMCIALTGALAFTIALVPSMAGENDPKVIFDGSKASSNNSDAFSFKNYDTYTDGSGNERIDLFTELKGVMPGDTISEEIDLEVTNISRATANIWLTAQRTDALPVEEGEEEEPGEEEISDESNLTPMLDDDEEELNIPSDDQLLGDDSEKPVIVKAASSNDMETLLASEYVTLTVRSGSESTDITGNLADGVLLGTFTSNASVPIIVELKVDEMAGNELADLAGSIDWAFTAEYIPRGGGGGGGSRTNIDDDPTPTTDLPPTEIGEDPTPTTDAPTEIVEDPTPASDAPGDGTGETDTPDTTEIVDEDVPLTSTGLIPTTGDDILLIAGAAAAACICLIAVVFILIRRKKRNN